MNPRKTARYSAAILIAAAMAVPTSLPAFAASSGGASATASAIDEFEAANPGLLAAMRRDLGLDAAAARTLGVKQEAAAATEEALRTALGDSFGGAYFDVAAGKLVVGVTDVSKVAQATSAGATAKLVSRSAAQLDSAIRTLNGRESAAPRSVTGWYADAVTNQVVVTALPGAIEAAKAFAGSDVRVVESAAPQTFADIKGGDAYIIGGSARCSVGLSVSGGFVTAGHCNVLTGGGALTRNGVALGTWGGASFPGNDYAWVRTNSNWTPRGLVGAVRVAGSTAAATGAAVCKSGSTSGWTCGTIGAKNQTVRYPQGTVTGLTATNVLCQAGDSGGGFVTNAGQGQGVVSGGNTATCFFQPLGEILSAFGLSLVRG
jgi:streptogrisin C